MISGDLNQKYEASSHNPELANTVIPEGKYRVKVVKFSEWKQSKKDLKIAQRDANNAFVLDAKGQKVMEVVKDCVFYNCSVHLEVIDNPQYQGKLLFYNLTTAQNMTWVIPNFLNACGLTNLSPAELPSYCVGKTLLADVYVDAYNKVVTDKDTGVDGTVKVEVNRVKTVMPDNSIEEELNELGL